MLLPKLFLPIVRKNRSSDQKSFFKFETAGREFSNALRSLEQIAQTVRSSQSNFW